MTQHGIVIGMQQDKFLVSVAKTSMCGENCASCKGCTPSNQIVIAENDTNEALHAGDSVLLETPSAKVIFGAAAVYLLPLVFLFGGYFLAAAFLENEAVCALISLLLASGTLLGLRFWDKRIKKKNTFSVRITKILRKIGA